MSRHATLAITCEALSTVTTAWRFSAVARCHSVTGTVSVDPAVTGVPIDATRIDGRPQTSGAVDAVALPHASVSTDLLAKSDASALGAVRFAPGVCDARKAKYTARITAMAGWSATVAPSGGPGTDDWDEGDADDAGGTDAGTDVAMDGGDALRGQAPGARRAYGDIHPAVTSFRGALDRRIGRADRGRGCWPIIEARPKRCRPPAGRR